MAGTVKTADQIKQALVLREAGYSLAAIAQKTGISTSTLSRHFKRHKADKGGLSANVVHEAKQQLLNDAGLIDDLKHEIASAIIDDISQFKSLREAIALNLNELLDDTSLAPHYRSRGLAALATTLRLSQELARKALKIDDLQPEPESMPQLIVSELTAKEIAQMRKAQQSDSIYDLPGEYADTEDIKAIEHD